MRFIKQDLGLGAYKQQTGQHLTVAINENRKKKSEHYKEILSTDEKIFTVEKTFNKQNNKVYANLFVVIVSRQPAQTLIHLPTNCGQF